MKHIRVHTGDKPFQCKDCDKRLSDKSLFLKHNTGSESKTANSEEETEEEKFEN